MNLDHVIVPSVDKVASSKFIAEILGVELKQGPGHFAPVKVNDTLTLDFDNVAGFERHHYAFHVSDAEFDAILARVKASEIDYGPRPQDQTSRELNQHAGGRGFYFRCPDGHSWEVLTHRA